MKLLTVLIAVFMFTFPVSAKVGDIAGDVYPTDIIAYIDRMQIPSYNIGGRTVIISEQLVDYGFKVEWNDEKRTLDIYTGRIPEIAPLLNRENYNNIYETDITVRFNGMWVESYNLGGRTAVVIEDMASTDASKQMSRDGNVFSQMGNYSIAGASAVWDEFRRTITLNVVRPGDYTAKNGFAIKGDYIMPVSYVITGISFENEKWVTAILKDGKIFIPYPIYEKYADYTEIIYDYASTRGSTRNNLLPLNFGEKEAYYYKGEAFVDFTETLKYVYDTTKTAMN